METSEMHEFEGSCFGIVGAGLIGGSICKSLSKSHPAIDILIYDQKIENSKYLEKHVPNAAAVDLIDIKKCDFVFLCLPVSSILNQIEKLNSYYSSETCTVIDTGSTKLKIVQLLNLNGIQNFVPGHPLAGGHTAGPEKSCINIIEGKPFAVCNSEHILPYHKKRSAALLESIGCEILEISPEFHDNLLAITSHLPHILSYSLVDTLIEMESDWKNDSKGFRVSSFKQLTYFAHSDPEMWADIFISNEAPIRLGVHKLVESMLNCLDLAAQNDREELINRLRKLQSKRSTY